MCTQEYVHTQYLNDCGARLAFALHHYNQFFTSIALKHNSSQSGDSLLLEN